jgi:hypothetical protein
MKMIQLTEITRSCKGIPIIDRYIENIEYMIKEDKIKGLKFMIERLNKHHKRKLLQLSITEGNLPLLKHLTGQKLSVHANDNEALRLSALGGHFQMVQFLVEEGGADIHAKNDEALRLSASEGHLEIVIFLVERGAIVRARDDHALRLSALKGHLLVVQHLVERGARVCAQHYFALRASKNRHPKVYDFLKSI